MEFLHILVLALIQALTEFLPVSSSGHLVLASELLGWEYQGLAFDLALHFGTLIAVMAYFRREVMELIGQTLRWRPGKPLNDAQRLAFGIALGTIPAGLAGLALGDAGALFLRHPLMIAANLVVFGALLWFADLHSRRVAAKDETNALASITFGKALLIGCAQALALMPGTSRSGATMTAGLLLGLPRTSAARYSFLLSIPVMVLATAHAAPVLAGKLLSGGEHIYVWEDALGSDMGQSIEPLFKSVPNAVRQDEALYAMLALVDAIRLGNEREANLAKTLLTQQLRGEPDGS